MMLSEAEFKRTFSLTIYKNLKLKLSEMSFFKDFVGDTRGDLYPLLDRSDDCRESVAHNVYSLYRGKVKRLFCSFFPYASYEISASTGEGSAGFSFIIPGIEAIIEVGDGFLKYSCSETARELVLPEYIGDEITMTVTCRPGAFDIYFLNNGKAEFFTTFDEAAFSDSNLESVFRGGKVALCVCGCAHVRSVCSYIDSGVSIADMKTVRYESGETMVECGRVYITASVRMQTGCFQGVFSWIPGTAELALTGAIFYDAGDGRWCGDVAASVIYHRAERRWYLWVCSFSHGHILGHAGFDGDPRFGVNVIDITLMEKACEGAKKSEFFGFSGDEDPDFFYDEEKKRWLLAICRIDPATRKYGYVFFESESPFDGYVYIGCGAEGAETGGSFVKVDGELCFLCGNDFHAVSDYRIYTKDGICGARFDYPDGGFRGWGTLVPVKMGSRTRYFWITFDRHKGSDYNWSYGNLYCFEAE